jgi:threonine/homoserine/homoserine lactone efflux protein
LEIIFFIKGFIIGIFVASPPGPVGTLCLRRTFSEGYISGLLSGLGVSTADAIYSFIAGFGLTGVLKFLISYQLWLRLICGIILCFLGINTFYHASSIKISTSPNSTSHVGTYMSALMLSLMNPAVIISFAALFAFMGLVGKGTNLTCSLTIVAGVFAGSACWWVILSGTVSMLNLKFNKRLIRRINHIAGILFVGFGLFMLGSTFFY